MLETRLRYKGHIVVHLPEDLGVSLLIVVATIYAFLSEWTDFTGQDRDLLVMLCKQSAPDSAICLKSK